MNKVVEERTLGRERLAVTGVVQGVGFRPYTYRLSRKFELSGFVCNTNGTVIIEIQGSTASIEAFVDELGRCPLPGAFITSCRRTRIETILSDSEFSIQPSLSEESTAQSLIPPDAATCENCLVELFDPLNRRYRYPFISCTDCGPRFTVIASLPYDRASTTMSDFHMCANCMDEYSNPSDRRFHSQLNACEFCGPSLTFINSQNQICTSKNENSIALTLNELEHGSIIAVKGLGGFHLICDATNSDAIAELRARKLRKMKPFAMMMRDIEMVKKYCVVPDYACRELTSPEHPIVLLEKHADCSLPDNIAPGIQRFGVMLPYTPLHHLILAEFNRPLIATSGNQKDEPIATENMEALRRLKPIADCFLLHDREIQFRCDDSVVQCANSMHVFFRRARGFTPLPVKLPFKAKVNALGCGAHLKNTFCLINNDDAFLSPHIGDLENLETLEHYEESIDKLTGSLDIEPEIIAHDLHPDFLSSTFARNYAERKSVSAFAVQHHHAHIVSCMVENGLTREVIGVAFDGLGFGSDSTLWGGEFMRASLQDFERLAHFKTFPLPGGNEAIRNPWRTALGCVDSVANPLPHFVNSLEAKYGKLAVNLVRHQIKKGLNAPMTSSCGRLFDAMSALLGICMESQYEGQAAVELENHATRDPQAFNYNEHETYHYSLKETVSPMIIGTKDVLIAAGQEHLSGASLPHIAAKFHRTIAKIISEVCLA